MTNWHALTAVILALGLAISLVLLAANELTHPGHLTSDETTVISTVLGATVGAVATYLGMGERSAPSEPLGGSDDRLVTRWPEESRLKPPYDQDAGPPTEEYPAPDG